MLSAFPAHDFVKSVIAAAEIRAGLKTSLAFEGIQWTASKIDAIRSQVDASAAFHVKDAANAVQGSDNKRDCWLAAWCLLHRIYEPFAARCHALAAYGDNQDNSDLYDDGWSMGAKLCALFGAHLDEALIDVYAAIQFEVRFELAMDAAFKVPWVPQLVTVETATLKGSIPAKGQEFDFSVIEPAQRSLFPTGDDSAPSPITEGTADEVALAMFCNLRRALPSTSVDSWSLMPYAPLRVLAGTGDWKAAFARDDLWTLIMSKEERAALKLATPSVGTLGALTTGRNIRAPYHALRYDTPGGPVLFGAVERGYFATKPEAAIIVNDGRDLTAKILYPGVYRTSQHERSTTVIDTAGAVIRSQASDRSMVVTLPDPKYLTSHLILSGANGWLNFGDSAPAPMPTPQPEDQPMTFDALNYFAAPEGSTLHARVKGDGEERRNTLTRRADGKPGLFVGEQHGLALLQEGIQSGVLHVTDDAIWLVYEERPGLQPTISRWFENYLWLSRHFTDGQKTTIQLVTHVLDNATKVEQSNSPLHTELDVLLNGPFNLRTVEGCQAAEVAMNANLTAKSLSIQKEWKWDYPPVLGLKGDCPLSLITRTDFWGGPSRLTMEIYGYLSLNGVGIPAFWAIADRATSGAKYALRRSIVLNELVKDGLAEPLIPAVAVAGLDGAPSPDPTPAPEPTPEPAPAPSPDQDVLTAYQDAEAALKRLGGLIGAS